VIWDGACDDDRIAMQKGTNKGPSETDNDNDIKEKKSSHHIFVASLGRRLFNFRPSLGQEGMKWGPAETDTN